MKKTLRNRVERLEESLPPDRTPKGKEDLRSWLKLLDNLPIAKRVIPQTEAEVADLRNACRAIAARVRAGEVTTTG